MSTLKPSYFLTDNHYLESLLRLVIKEEIEQITTKLNREIKMLTRDEAAEKLSVSPNTISEWVRSGRLINRGIGRKILILDSDLEGIRPKVYSRYKSILKVD
jgi:excisionase family DNA binding protein